MSLSDIMRIVLLEPCMTYFKLTLLYCTIWCIRKRSSKILKGQTEIVKSEERQDHGQQNEMKGKHRTHTHTSLYNKTK